MSTLPGIGLARRNVPMVKSILRLTRRGPLGNPCSQNQIYPFYIFSVPTVTFEFNLVKIAGKKTFETKWKKFTIKTFYLGHKNVFQNMVDPKFKNKSANYCAPG